MHKWEIFHLTSPNELEDLISSRNCEIWNLKINIQFGFLSFVPSFSRKFRYARRQFELETLIRWKVRFWQFSKLIVLSAQQLAQKAFNAKPIICSE